MTVIDARTRFGLTCRRCDQPAAVIVYPHVDHRRRKPWPEPYGLCDKHKYT